MLKKIHYYRERLKQRLRYWCDLFQSSSGRLYLANAIAKINRSRSMTQLDFLAVNSVFYLGFGT